MSRTADVDGMRLTMPAGWWVWKYDDSDFHQTQFQNFAGGVKAMDAIALDPAQTLWLIEVKDYRQNRRRKPSSVFAEVADKARDTLAGLSVARVSAKAQRERTLAQQALGSRQIRVALQLAQSARPHRLFPQVVESADADIQLRRAVKQVDAKPVCAVGSLGQHNSVLPWNTVAI
ncbi:hypothetical protein [[Acidovorax] ebreus]|uniref:hypothetical protein n=1 Tax=Diaphorobacter sp. LI3 TaxID=2952886 RepID=UPI002051DE51|nr:hypothetical protein MRB47_02560 [Diaphorobacter sp. LI3]